MNNEKELGMFRTLLRNEVTWFIFLITGVLGFFTQVIIPLNSLQIGQAQILKTLAEEQLKYKQWEIRLGTMEVQNAKMQTQVDSLLK